MNLNLLTTAFLLIFPCTVLCLRCWVCGEDRSPYDTNPNSDRGGGSSNSYRRGSSGNNNQQYSADGGNSQGGLKGAAWCSTSISNASCAAVDSQGGQQEEVQCYKEMWSVDGKDLVKRGCARKDARYNRTGCEEQMTGQGNFGVVLCLCNGNLCNSAEGGGGPDVSFLFNLGICLWAVTLGK